jgi:hypothetical protein
MAMKTRRLTKVAIRVGLAGCVLAIAAPMLVADSNIADIKKFTWGENIGHMNWADANARAQGVEIYQLGATQYLSGSAWCENIGWVNVGNGGAPYANTDGTNFGVNINTATGDMSGFAWGENVGWINFGPFPPATLVASAHWDYANHRSTGYAWGENIGWINLDDAIEFICQIPGDLDFNGNVNVFDFGAFAVNFGSAGNPPFTNGDVDGDGDADVFDFAAFAPNFGETCP